MTMGRPKAELVLTDDERSQLQSFARSRSLPSVLSDRARIVLSSADGEANNSIAQRLKLTNATVGKWRTRFIGRRIAGLYDDVRPGKPRTIDDQVERFFALITDKAIRRGSFARVKQLVQRIDHFVAAHNENCQPFRWTGTADSILEKLHRLCSRIAGTGH